MRQYSELLETVSDILIQGVVIKFNANQRYATTAITASIVRRIASKVHVPLQVRHWPSVPLQVYR